MQAILNLWLLATAVFLAGALTWAFVPVLVPIVGVTLGIGALVALIVGFARWLERVRDRRRND